MFDHAAAHFRDFFDEEGGLVGLTCSGVLAFEGHGYVAEGFLTFGGGFWVVGAVNGVESEFGRFFEAVEGVWIFLGT